MVLFFHICNYKYKQKTQKNADSIIKLRILSLLKINVSTKPFFFHLICSDGHFRMFDIGTFQIHSKKISYAHLPTYNVVSYPFLGYVNECLSRQYLLDPIFYQTVGMVMYHHEPEHLSKRLVRSLQG